MKNKYLIIALISVLVAGIIYMLYDPDKEVINSQDEFEGWERFGMNESYEVGAFINVEKDKLKSAIITAKYLDSPKTISDDLLSMKITDVFDTKSIDYTSTFNASILGSAVSFDFKKALDGLKNVKFNVFGGKQRRLEKGTVVIGEVVRNLPDFAIVDMQNALNMHDSIVFITEVIMYERSNYEINWNKELSPKVKSSVESELASLGSDGSWKKNKNYTLISSKPKNFLYKYEPLDDSLKNFIFNKNKEIVAKQRDMILETPRLAQEVSKKGWSSGKINDKSWRFTGVDAVLTEDGRLNISGSQSSNRWEGFTASLAVQLLDENKQPIKNLVTKPVGVNGMNSRKFDQSFVITPDVAAKVKYIDLEAKKR